MAFKDILVTLTSYPEPTPGFIIENAVLIADALGAHIAALSYEVHVQLPGHFLSGSVVGLPGVIAGEAGKSRRNAQDLIAAFEAAAARSSVSRESTINKCKSFEVPDLLVEYARLHDLTIMPASDDRWDCEAVIFGSGRPVLVLPQNPQSRLFEIGTVAVAWDFSRAAARAVSDAIPLLEKAKKVRVVTVFNEKHLDNKCSAEQLSKNLSRHGFDVVLDRIDAKGRPIGAVLEAYVASHEVDLLVMGAYGHSRLREFVLARWRDQESAVEAAAAHSVLALTKMKGDAIDEFFQPIRDRSPVPALDNGYPGDRCVDARHIRRRIAQGWRSRHRPLYSHFRRTVDSGRADNAVGVEDSRTAAAP